MARQDRTAEEILARLGTRAHGVVTWAELRDAGMSEDEIRRRVRIGLLIRVYRGVYRVGHRAPSVEADYLAAVKACGAGALLSGRAAGHLLRLVKGVAPAPEVTTATERRVAGLRTRRSRDICERYGMLFRAVPVTTVACTLVDLAAVLPAEDLARACHEAGVLYRTTPRQVDAVLTQRPNSRGAAALRAVMSGDVRVTLSMLERRFLERLRRAGLPLPETNRCASGRRVDCRWPAQRLTVELDSYRYHHSRHAWEQGYRREREARKRGDEFRRYTHRDVFEDPRDMLRELRALLT